MTAFVAASLLTLAPSPYDHLTAGADLTSPAGTPPLADRSPRMKLALLIGMVRLGALDATAPDFRWFSPDLSWASEIDHARRLVARVRACPEDDWLPPPSWFAGVAQHYHAAADRWRRRAAEYRDRVAWEIDREESLHAWARWMDAEADRLSAESCRLGGWGGTSWQRPRRVVLAEVKEAIGPAAWERRELPGW